MAFQLEKFVTNSYDKERYGLHYKHFRLYMKKYRHEFEKDTQSVNT